MGAGLDKRRSTSSSSSGKRDKQTLSRLRLFSRIASSPHCPFALAEALSKSSGRNQHLRRESLVLSDENYTRISSSRHRLTGAELLSDSVALQPPTTASGKDIPRALLVRRQPTGRVLSAILIPCLRIGASRDDIRR